MNHKQLVQQMAEMKAELDNLRSQVSSYENVEEAPAPASSATSSRRKLLKRMAVAGIGGIGALGLAATVGSNNTVLAATSSNNAIEATGGTDGYGLQASGGVAPLYLIGSTGTGAPTTGNHQKGELYVDSVGALYYCIVGNNTNAGTWRQLAGTATSGALHLFASPARFIDTRTPNINDPAGPYAPNTTRTYNMTTITAGSVSIPSGATAVIGNITAVSPTGSGFAAVYSGTYNNTSNLNFTQGVTLATSFTSSLSATGQMSILVKMPVPADGSGRVNILVDIAGYYL